MPIIDPTVALATRQEAFCRHYAVSGNAADAARQAGYSERSARQTGCALLERPYIVERLRRIRLSWKRTERDEARIMLARSEQVWDAAVASGSAYMMLRVLRFQAEIAGLVGSAGGNRARLWPLAHEDELGEVGAGEALEVGTEPGPLAEAVRCGRDRARGALERHRGRREALEGQEGFDGAAHEEAALRLAEAVEERMRLPVTFAPLPEPANDLPPPTTRPSRSTRTTRGPGATGPAIRTGSTTTGPTGPNMTGSTSAATTTPTSTTPGLRRRSSSAGRAASNGKKKPSGSATRTGTRTTGTMTMSTGTTTRTGRTGTGSTASNSRPAMTSHDNS